MEEPTSSDRLISDDNGDTIQIIQQDTAPSDIIEFTQNPNNPTPNADRNNIITSPMMTVQREPFSRSNMNSIYFDPETGDVIYVVNGVYSNGSHGNLSLPPIIEQRTNNHTNNYFTGNPLIINDNHDVMTKELNDNTTANDNMALCPNTTMSTRQPATHIIPQIPTNAGNTDIPTSQADDKRLFRNPDGTTRQITFRSMNQTVPQYNRGNYHTSVPAIPAVSNNNRPTVPVIPIVSNNNRSTAPAIAPTNAMQLVPAQNPFPMTLNVTKPTNPYLGIPRNMLNNIAQERDIALNGTAEERAAQLYEYDQIMPDWLQSITSKTVNNFQMLTGSKLYVFGALHGVRLTDANKLTGRELVNYIRVTILLSDRNHPNANVLPTLINTMSRTLLEFINSEKSLIPNSIIKFISTDDLRTAITLNSFTHINHGNIKALVDRFDNLKRHKYSRLIAKLYSIDYSDEDDWVTVAKRIPHPMESFLLDLDKFSHNQITESFGMIIPPSQSNNIDVYIKDNIVDYSKILTRNISELLPLDVLKYINSESLIEYISKLTDKEIFTNIGVYVHYQSRNDLVRKIASTITTPQFMFPSVRVLKRCRNTETPITMSRVDDSTLFMLCYGTAEKYYMYEPEELTGAFYRDDETGVMDFRRPENVDVKFPNKDIEQLRQLLTCFPATPELTNLISIIDEGLIDATDKIAFDDTARAQLKIFNADTKQLIHLFLRQVFYTGMYMRRWNGPGNPFPLKENETKQKIEPDAKVTEQLGIGLEYLNQMSTAAKTFCLNLKICQYGKNGAIDVGISSFSKEWDKVIRGVQCIRIASSMFVGTGYHYLRALFRETIPGMDVKNIDRIM